jgi:hypothetical protein
MQNQFVDQSLAARLEDAQAWRAAYYAQANVEQSRNATAEIITVAGAQVIYGGMGIPVNRAIGLGMHGAVTEEDIEVIEAFYTERKADIIIDLCPLADPSLLPLLQTRGYAIWYWMSMLFMSLPSAPITLNPAIKVSRATPNQAELWLATSVRGFDEREEVDDSTLRVLTPNFYAANANCYFAWLGDTPIATGGMYPHRGVAELGGASTRLPHRRQGAQSALIEQRLADAYALGCDIASVLTLAGSESQRNLQRRGFQLAYTRAICKLSSPIP